MDEYEDDLGWPAKTGIPCTFEYEKLEHHANVTLRAHTSLRMASTIPKTTTIVALCQTSRGDATESQYGMEKRV